MNAPLKPTPPLTAQQLADLPYTEGKDALIRQECAHMQQHHAERLLKEIRVEQDDLRIARVSCVNLEGRVFTWEWYQDCELCGATGEVHGNGQAYTCPACRGDLGEIFYTDYDGNLAAEPE